MPLNWCPVRLFSQSVPSIFLSSIHGLTGVTANTHPYLWHMMGNLTSECGVQQGDPLGPLLAPSWPPLGPLLAPSWPPLGPLLASSWPPLGPIMASSWPPLGPLLAPSWHPLGPLLFSLVLNILATEIASDAGCAHLLYHAWYLDDGVVAGPSTEIRRVLAIL